MGCFERMELISKTSRDAHKSGGELYGGAELLRRGLRWRVHRGDRVLFWKDVWAGEDLLMPRAMDVFTEDESERKVEEYWQQGSGWRWNLFLVPCRGLELAKVGWLDSLGIYGFKTDDLQAVSKPKRIRISCYA